MSSYPHVPELFAENVADHPDRVFLHWICPNDPTEPQSYTYGEFGDWVARLMSVFQDRGLQRGKRLLLLAENSPAWQAVSIAAQTLAVEVAAPFAHLDGHSIQDIMLRFQPNFLVFSKEALFAKARPVLKDLRSVWGMMSLEEPFSSVPEKISSMTFAEALEKAPLSQEEFKKAVSEVRAEDPFLTIFTSGTTGKQKGVRLSQGGFGAGLEWGAATLNIHEPKLGLMFLPFSHVAGQCLFNVAFKYGGSHIICSRREDIPEALKLAPDFTLLVPFFFERIYEDMEGNIRRSPSWIRSPLNAMFQVAIRQGRGEALTLREKGLLSLAKGILGRKLRKKLGGKMKLMVTGGGPTREDVVALFRGLGMEFLIYYGMSETGGGIVLGMATDPIKKVGSPGRPWKLNEVKIAEDGEILVRGQTMMSGYLEREDEEGAFDEDGFFKTGDLGYFDEDGLLFITGRKKHLLVLTTGKKVPSEVVEQRVKSLLPVHEAVALGDGRPFVAAALFVPRKFLAKHDLQTLESKWLKKIQSHWRGLSAYECPKRLILLPGLPNEVPGLLTSTLKLKRSVFEEAFAEPIDQVYREGRVGEPATRMGS